MGSVGDVLQLTDEGEQASQQCLNVYFYRLDTPVVGNAAEMLCASWIDQVLPEIVSWQASDFVHKSVSVKNLFNPSEEFTELMSEPGERDVDVFPTFNAVGFRLIGDNAAVRDGQKRFAGVPEDSAEDGVFTDTTFLAAMVTLGTAIVAGLPIGLDIDALIPVIVQRIADGDGYRLPTNAGEAVLSEVIDSLFNIDVTSQTSRKPGRGA